MSTFRGTLAALVALLFLFIAFTAPVAATKPDPEHKVGICHRTASDENPYVYIEVDEASLSPGHLDNDDPGHKPTFWKSDGTFRGVEHKDGDPKDDYLAPNGKEDCEDTTSTPTPTPTPSPTPTPTPTSEPTPTPTDTPTTTPTTAPSDTPTGTDTPRGFLPPTDTIDTGSTGPSRDAILALGAILVAAGVAGYLWSERRRRQNGRDHDI